jgi:argininosuccinate synthase
MIANKKIILAYSGGLDTSVAIAWLKEKYQYDVIALTADVGEGKDLSFIEKKALKIGAAHCYIIDAKEKFAQEFIIPSLYANARYENVYPLISALSRPLIAHYLVDIAQKENAIAVAHGCTGKGNDQVRFEVAIQTLNPQLQIIAPVRENPMSREEAINYAQLHDIPLPIDLTNPFSIDQNLWGRSCECGILEDPWIEPPEEAYAWTNALSKCPEQSEIITIKFHQGIPIALNDEPMELVTLISTLNAIGGKHGIGRIDHVENRLVGIKSREIYEAPAATILIHAHQALETITLTRELAHFKPIVEQQYTKLVYEGLWNTPLMQCICAFLKQSQENVSGEIRIKLHKGHAIVIGRQSSQSLYNLELATYKANDLFDHQAAEGFIKIWGLPYKAQSTLQINKYNEVKQ